MAGCVWPRQLTLGELFFAPFLEYTYGDTYRRSLCSKNLKIRPQKELEQDISIFFGSMAMSSGRIRLNLNPLNLVRWIDSWPFDKTWKPGWIDSTWVNRFNGRAMNLEWIFIKTLSRARKSFSKASPYFFCEDRAGFDGDRFNAVRLFRVISEDSAERDSLDESSAFLIEGAKCRTQNNVQHCRASCTVTWTAVVGGKQRLCLCFVLPLFSPQKRFPHPAFLAVPCGFVLRFLAFVTASRPPRF